MQLAIQIYQVFDPNNRTRRITSDIWEKVREFYKIEVHEVSNDDLKKLIGKKVHLIIFEGMRPKEISYATIEKIQSENIHVHTMYVAGDLNAQLATKIYDQHIDYIINGSYDDQYLIAKIKTVLKRKSSKYHIDLSLYYKNIEVDRLINEVRINHEAVDTTHKEYKIIELLVLEATKFIPKKTILMKVWGYDEDPTRILDQYILRVKNKLKDHAKIDYDKLQGIRII